MTRRQHGRTYAPAAYRCFCRLSLVVSDPVKRRYRVRPNWLYSPWMVRGFAPALIRQGSNPGLDFLSPKLFWLSKLLICLFAVHENNWGACNLCLMEFVVNRFVYACIIRVYHPWPGDNEGSDKGVARQYTPSCDPGQNEIQEPSEKIW